jgi:hypothetical protein
MGFDDCSRCGWRKSLLPFLIFIAKNFSFLSLHIRKIRLFAFALALFTGALE